MGIFVNENLNDENDIVIENVEALVEAYTFDDISRYPQDVREEFIGSEEAQVMVTEGIITKRTLVRLSKKDDIERRETMAAFQIAKEKDDMLWTKLAKNRVKERELIAAIVQKYGNKAKRAAIIGQKAYLKKNKGFGKMFSKMTGH